MQRRTVQFHSKEKAQRAFSAFWGNHSPPTSHCQAMPCAHPTKYTYWHHYTKQTHLISALKATHAQLKTTTRLAETQRNHTSFINDFTLTPKDNKRKASELSGQTGQGLLNDCPLVVHGQQSPTNTPNIFFLLLSIDNNGICHSSEHPSGDFTFHFKSEQTFSSSAPDDSYQFRVVHGQHGISLQRNTSLGQTRNCSHSLLIKLVDLCCPWTTSTQQYCKPQPRSVIPVCLVVDGEKEGLTRLAMTQFGRDHGAAIFPLLPMDDKGKIAPIDRSAVQRGLGNLSLVVHGQQNGASMP